MHTHGPLGGCWYQLPLSQALAIVGGLSLTYLGGFGCADAIGKICPLLINMLPSVQHGFVVPETERRVSRMPGMHLSTEPHPSPSVLLEVISA